MNVEKSTHVGYVQKGVMETFKEETAINKKEKTIPPLEKLKEDNKGKVVDIKG